MASLFQSAGLVVGADRKGALGGRMTGAGASIARSASDNLAVLDPAKAGLSRFRIKAPTEAKPRRCWPS